MGKEIHFEGRPVWAEISGGALTHNLRAIRRHIGRRRKVLAIVKGNAYGHGGALVAKVLAKAGADVLGVTCTAEGIELREAGIRKPVLILTGAWPGEEKRLFRYAFTPSVTRVEQLSLLERAAVRARRRLPFHLKVDTGMNRLGIDPGDVDRFVRALADCPHLALVATFTHFASSDAISNDQTDRQFETFRGVVTRLRAAGVNPGLLHLANSAAIGARPDTWADMVRPGVLLYGYHPRFDPPERRAEAERQIPLRPVMALRTRVVQLRDVPAGAGVGYSARFVADRPSRIAVISAGYADGVLRVRSNHGCILLRGRRVPLVGTISMDLTTVDVTDLPDVRIGDVATIYGSDSAGNQIRAADVARELGTVTSDLLCAVGARVPRFLVP